MLRRTFLTGLAAGVSPLAAQDSAGQELSPILPLHLGDLGALPIVQARLAGQACRALIDTGASAHIVNARWAARHALPVLGRQRLTTVAGPQWVDRVELLSPAIGGTPLPGAEHALAVDLHSAFAPFVEPGGGIDMIAGVAALRERATFDMAAQTLIWRTSPADLQEALTIEVRLQAGLPVIELAVGGRAPAPFLFDTGNAGALVVFVRQAERWLGEGLVLPQTVAQEVGGPVRALHALAEQVRAGDWRVIDVPLAFEAGAHARRGGHFDAMAGSAGLALFAGRSVTLDIQAGRLALGPIRGSDHVPGGFGMRIVGNASQLPAVQAVFDDGPAARAGIRAGDALLAIDDQQVPEWSAARIWAWLADRAEATFTVQPPQHAPRRVRLQRAAFFPRWR